MLVGETKYLDYSLLDGMLGSGLDFAIYSLPGSEQLNMIVQINDHAKCLYSYSDVDPAEGFVISPFDISSENPIMLIRNDLKFENEYQIFSWIEEQGFDINQNVCKNDYGPLLSTDEYGRYCKTFDRFKSFLTDGVCEKIVLSRKKAIIKPENFSLGMTFRKAFESYPEAMVCMFKTIHSGTWLTITPEIIISGKGDDWQTVSLAGTKFDDNGNENIWDNKNVNEQEIVTSFIRKKLLEKEITFTMNGPYTIKAGKLKHLKTEFKMNLRFNSYLSDLLFSLHPTPAVSGYPKDIAMEIIRSNEGHDRKYYCGFCGPISKNGETSLYVNLRCMEITDNALILYAGGGLIDDSEIENEWEETEAKFNTMLSIIDK